MVFFEAIKLKEIIKRVKVTKEVRYAATPGALQHLEIKDMKRNQQETKKQPGRVFQGRGKDRSIVKCFPLVK